MIVEIHSLSPGAIIGKRGECIDRLKSYLENQLAKPIEINLQETNPFK
jgi:ribosomal protein S3